MTHLRVGIDVVDVDEVVESLAQFGDRYLARVFSDAERAVARDGLADDVAARFAVKEAALKAIGDAEPFDWRSIEVLNTADGKELHLTGRAAESAEKLGIQRWSISTSVTKRHALAVALAAVQP